MKKKEEKLKKKRFSMFNTGKGKKENKKKV